MRALLAHQHPVEVNYRDGTTERYPAQPATDSEDALLELAAYRAAEKIVASMHTKADSQVEYEIADAIIACNRERARGERK